MDGTILIGSNQNNLNQLLANARYLTFNTAQQMDTRLMAFITILTVAFSIILSFKQSRCYIIKNTRNPLRNVKKCIKCLKEATCSSHTYTRLLNRKNKLTKYLKLKRLTSIASSTFNKYCMRTVRNVARLKFRSNVATSVSTQTSSHALLSSSSIRKMSFLRFRSTKRDLKSFVSTPNLLNHHHHKQRNDDLFDSVSQFCSTRCIENLIEELDENEAISRPQFDLGPVDDSARSYNRYSASDDSDSHDDEDDEYADNFLMTFIKLYNSFILSTCKTVIEYYKHHLTIKKFRRFEYRWSNEKKRSFNSRVRLYRKLPLRSMSRAWGKLNSIDLPIWFRRPCYQFYSWVFNCNLKEIAIEDLNEYKNLSEFFRRSLKPQARIVDQNSCLVCPCDGKVLNIGRVDDGLLEQVKGVNYSLKGFLGAQNWPKNQSTSLATSQYASKKSETMTDMKSLQDQVNDDNALYEKSVLYNPKNRLYHCIIYLAPGDYHRFHSPTDWTVFYRRHFPGELFSVNPSVARWLQGLFNLNERVVYYGQWKHGFFSMSPVGATNVGSIKVFMDDELTTNNELDKNQASLLKGVDKSFHSQHPKNVKELQGVKINRGDIFGEFNLGSTIVLVFEAPENFEFNIKPNEKVYFGQQLGSSF